MEYFIQRLKPLCQYDNEKEDLHRSSKESEEDDEGEIPVEELLKKPKIGKKGTRVQWEKHLADDLLDVILDNDKYKVKLLGGERVLARFPPAPPFSTTLVWRLIKDI